MRIQQLSDDLAASVGLAKNRGEFIQSVEPGQGAAKAGMQPGDVVVRVDGKDVTPDQTLSFIVANTAPGKRIPIDVIRDGKRMTLQAVVGKRPSEEELAQNSFDPDAQQGDDNGFGGPDKAKPSAGPVVPAGTGYRRHPADPADRAPTGARAKTPRAWSSRRSTLRQTRRPRVCSAATSCFRPTTSRVVTTADLEAVVRQAKAERREAVLLRIQRRGQPPVYMPIRLR